MVSYKILEIFKKNLIFFIFLWVWCCSRVLVMVKLVIF